METAMKIRRQVLVEGKSIRSVSKKMNVSRNTVRKYLKQESPPGYQLQTPKPRHQLGPYEEQLKSWYTYDLSRPLRERRTGVKLYQQLIHEGYEGSYHTVCRYLKQLKAQLKSPEAFIPLSFDPGEAFQFDWGSEEVILADIDQKVKVAHFRLSYSRYPFLIAYLRETQEMLLDAFVEAMEFYQGVPKKVIIDNPKTMVCYIGRGKERRFHPRFLALMNHYLMEPVPCTPGAAWEKGQVENQVKCLRKQLFAPKLSFPSLEALNDYLRARCLEIANNPHPEDKSRTIGECYQEELPFLRPAMRPFDGYLEKTVRATSTCLIQYECNRYSVPSQYAGQKVSLHIYARHLKVVAEQTVIAEHARNFGKYQTFFEPWHYVPLLKKKPGALRNGAPFKHWALPQPLLVLKKRYLGQPQGDKEFVQLLLLIQQYDMETVTLACQLAIEEKTYRLPAIINMLHRLTETPVNESIKTSRYPTVKHLPQADCQRYEQLREESL